LVPYQGDGLTKRGDCPARKSNTMRPKMRIPALIATVALATPFILAACNDEGTESEIGESALLSVVPQG
jgi:hypothetical protein